MPFSHALVSLSLLKAVQLVSLSSRQLGCLTGWLNLLDSIFLQSSIPMCISVDSGLLYFVSFRNFLKCLSLFWGLKNILKNGMFYPILAPSSPHLRYIVSLWGFLLISEKIAIQQLVFFFSRNRISLIHVLYCSLVSNYAFHLLSLLFCPLNFQFDSFS